MLSSFELLLISVSILVFAMAVFERFRADRFVGMLDAQSRKHLDFEKKLAYIQNSLLDRISDLEKVNTQLMQANYQQAIQNEDLEEMVRELTIQYRHSCPDAFSEWSSDERRSNFLSQLEIGRNQSLAKRLLKLQGNLNTLLEAKANLGGSVDLSLENNIAFHHDAIEVLRTELKLPRGHHDND